MINTIYDVREQLRMIDECTPHGEMVELIGACFHVYAEDKAIFGTPNEEYIKEELRWYASMSRNVNDIAKTPAIWKQIADKHGNINSNYGWCLFSEQNGNQLRHVITELLNNRQSRRAAAIYMRPSMHIDAKANGMNDFMCTYATTHFIRNNELWSVVSMRSNDAVFGFKNDVAWQRHVHKIIAQNTGAEQGPIVWQAASLHVYPRHRHLIKEYYENLFTEQSSGQQAADRRAE